jgi:hypothetical protein
MNKVKISLAGAAVLVALALGSGGASAMPNGLSSATLTENPQVEDVRWVCGRFGCRWRPNVFWGSRWGWRYRSFAFAPRPWIGPRWGWGWRHRWW